MEEDGANLIHGDYRRRKYGIIIAAAIFSALTAPLSILLHKGTAQAQLFNITSIIVYGVLVLGWCYYDSLERNESLGLGLRGIIVLLGVIGLFIYLLKSRGLKRGLLAIGLALLVCVGIVLVTFLSTLLTAMIFRVR